jgi:murein DD-endopeptidase MepM/ murein hydrolase activator NlpD
MVVSTSPALIETPTASVSVKPAAANGKFRWPVSGTVITDFADSRSGINIAALEGTAVRAAEGGQVIYTGSAVEDFGNLILIKHDNGYVTAYAHLKDITVAKGETIDRGDAIGSIGMTGGVSRPQLHFELRKGATPVDPMPLLAG